MSTKKQAKMISQIRLYDLYHVNDKKETGKEKLCWLFFQ